MKKLISIIIPVYNVSEYLNLCLESIVKQKPVNIEVIIINDGSTDSSGNIADCYAKQYDYIEVIHQSNQGVSAARNSGIERAQGLYLAFLDADDILYDSFFENVLQIIVFQPDIIEFNADIIDIEGRLSNKNIFYISRFRKLSNNTKQSKLRFIKQAKYYLWSRIIKKDLIKGLSFEEDISFCEDALYLTECYFRAKKIITLNKSLYGYRQHNTNITKVNTSNNINQLSKLAEIIKDKTENSTDMKYIDFYNSLLINIIHLRKSMYAIAHKSIVCDKTTLENIERVKMFNKPSVFSKESSVSWLRRFSILAPKTSNSFILLKILIKKQ